MVLTGPDGVRRDPVRMTKHGDVPDRYDAWVTPDAPGAWTFEIQAWSDPVATWQHAAGLKIPAGVDVDLMFMEGRILLEQVQATLSPTSDEARVVQGAIEATADVGRPPEARLAVLEDPELVDVLLRHPLRELTTTEGPYPAYADRELALFGSWYEFFPRSEGAVQRPDGGVISGNFRTAAKRLDAVAEMGFDVIYLPPIHPIGEVNRKGRNNTLDPGSTTPAHRGRSAPRTAVTTRSTPTSAPSRTSTPSSRTPTASASRSPSTWRSRSRRTIPGSRPTRSSSPPGPTGPSPTRRTRRRSTRTSTR